VALDKGGLAGATITDQKHFELGGLRARLAAAAREGGEGEVPAEPLFNIVPACKKNDSITLHHARAPILIRAAFAQHIRKLLPPKHTQAPPPPPRALVCGWRAPLSQHAHAAAAAKIKRQKGFQCDAVRGVACVVTQRAAPVSTLLKNSVSSEPIALVARNGGLIQPAAVFLNCNATPTRTHTHTHVFSRLSTAITRHTHDHAQQRFFSFVVCATCDM